MYSILIVAVGLLQLTSAAVVPKPRAEPVKPTALSKDAFTANGFPSLYSWRWGDVVEDGISYSFSSFKPSPMSASAQKDVPILQYQPAKRQTKLDVKLVKPARKGSADAKAGSQGLVPGDAQGTVHDVVGTIDQKNILDLYTGATIPIERLEGGGELTNGEYHVVVQVRASEQSQSGSTNGGRWISQSFIVQRSASVGSA